MGSVTEKEVAMDDVDKKAGQDDEDKSVETIAIKEMMCNVEPMLLDSGKDLQDEKDNKESVTRQLLAAISVDIGSLVAGTTLAWTSPCLEYFENDLSAPFRLTVEESSWVGSILGLGALISAIPSAWAAEKIGRRNAFFICVCAPYLISWPTILYSQTVWQLILARLIQGFGVGGVCTLGPMYIGETSGDKSRSWLGSLFPLAFSSGITLTYLFISFGIEYRLLTVILGSLPFLNTIAVWFFTPESPTWYARSGRRDQATKSLVVLGRRVRQDLAQIEHDIASAPPAVTLMTVLRQKGYRMRLIAAILLFVFQQLSGINAVMFYTVSIFKAADAGMDPVQCSFLVAAIQVVGVAIISFVINKLGRRVLLLASAAITALCHMSLGIYFQIKISSGDAPGWLPLTSLLLFVLVFALGFGSVPWVQLHELSPGECASILGAAAMLANWSTGTIVTKTFGPAANVWGEHVVFYAYAVLNAIGVLLIIIFIPETRFKQQHDIFPKYKI